MFLISDISGLFLIPYGATLGANAWELLYDSGLWLIPFLIVLIREVFVSRAQGADEGSAASLAYRRVEMSYLSMFVLIYLFVFPGSNAPTWTHKSASCVNNESVIAGDPTFAGMTPSSAVAGGRVVYGTDSPPIMVSIFNNAANAFSTTLIMKSGCKRGVDIKSVSETLDEVVIPYPTIQSNVAAFFEQCYLPAADKLKSALDNGTELVQPVENLTLGAETLQYMHFNSPQFKRIYQDLYIVGKPQSDVMNLDVPPGWPTAVGSFHPCAAASDEVLDTIDHYIDDAFGVRPGWSGHPTIERSPEFADVHDFFNLYGNYGADEVKAELQTYLFTKTAMSIYNEGWQLEHDLKSRSILAGANAWADVKPSPDIKKDSAAKSMGVSSRSSTAIFGVDSMLAWGADQMMALGGTYTAFTSGFKSIAAVSAAPILVSVGIAFLLAIFPIVIFLSGYSWSTAWSLCVTLIGLCMIPLWLNLGIMFATYLTAYSAFEGNMYSSYEIVANAAIYTAPVLWMALIQQVGGISGTYMASVGDDIAKGAESAMKLAWKEGGKPAVKGSWKAATKSMGKDGPGGGSGEA
ncbi:hypothetical protein [Vibrio barjaei]|uniref:hypothetical protein n=1 Tax=Vibrio barjaei TaxID=1676683 RepID=UPI0022834C92|nr:hypothetical protein [Vibrio barjaei]MCY9874558.1 hypothetical protein [Vibrio barjaei]